MTRYGPCIDAQVVSIVKASESTTFDSMSDLGGDSSQAMAIAMQIIADRRARYGLDRLVIFPALVRRLIMMSKSRWRFGGSPCRTVRIASQAAGGTAIGRMDAETTG